MLTAKQQRILTFIQTYIARHGKGPTLDEIGAAVGIASRGTVHRYVESLIAAGVLTRAARGWRTLRLAAPKRDTAARAVLPLAGRIAAGRPIEAIPGRDEINLSELFAGSGRYVLEVEGDSMIEVGILDGDLVVVKPRDTADNGAIVVALIDDMEATLKRFYRLPDGRIELKPENTELAPFVYAPERIRIQGVLVGQLRRY